MTLLPNPRPHQNPPNQVPGTLAPAREIYKVARKCLADGRCLEFVWHVDTQATPEGTYRTLDLVQAPALDCPCTPFGPEDVVSCSKCMAAVCVQRHSFTCMHCGRVFCSACLVGIELEGMEVVTCKDCAEQLTASWSRKILKSLKGLFWG